MPLVLGIDFEHIHHTPAYRSLENPSRISIDLDGITNRLLQLLSRYDSKATFFVVADLAKEQPELIRKIANAGHEIASHTVTHPSLPSLDASKTRNEIRESKTILENITGKTVEGFRAPTFQISDDIYSLLTEAGFRYSSSVVPSLPIPGFYSNKYDFQELTEVTTPAGTLIEQPVAVNPWFKLPVSGAWTRLFGRTYTIKSIQKLLRHDLPVLTYSHPWEFTSLWDTPLPFRNRVRTGEWLFETYERLLETGPSSVTVGDYLADNQPTTQYNIPRT